MSAKIPMESSLAISVQSLETAWALSDRNNVSGAFVPWCCVVLCCGVVLCCLLRSGLLRVLAFLYACCESARMCD